MYKNEDFSETFVGSNHVVRVFEETFEMYGRYMFVKEPMRAIRAGAACWELVNLYPVYKDLHLSSCVETFAQRYLQSCSSFAPHFPSQAMVFRDCPANMMFLEEGLEPIKVWNCFRQEASIETSLTGLMSHGHFYGAVRLEDGTCRYIWDELICVDEHPLGFWNLKGSQQPLRTRLFGVHEKGLYPEWCYSCYNTNVVAPLSPFAGLETGCHFTKVKDFQKHYLYTRVGLQISKGYSKPYIEINHKANLVLRGDPKEIWDFEALGIPVDPGNRFSGPMVTWNLIPEEEFLNFLENTQGWSLAQRSAKKHVVLESRVGFFLVEECLNMPRDQEKCKNAPLMWEGAQVLGKLLENPLVKHRFDNGHALESMNENKIRSGRDALNKPIPGSLNTTQLLVAEQKPVNIEGKNPFVCPMVGCPDMVTYQGRNFWKNSNTYEGYFRSKDLVEFNHQGYMLDI